MRRRTSLVSLVYIRCAELSAEAAVRTLSSETPSPRRNARGNTSGYGLRDRDDTRVSRFPSATRRATNPLPFRIRSCRPARS